MKTLSSHHNDFNLYSALMTPSTNLSAQTALTQKIQKHLISGLSQEATAMACGCSPGYISDLMQNEEFSKPVKDAIAAKAVISVESDSLISEIKHDLLVKLKKSVALMHKPGDILKSLQVIGNMRKDAPEQSPGVTAPQQNTFVFNLPPAFQASPEFRFNVNNMAVQVGERTLVAMPSNSLVEFAHGQANDTKRFRPDESSDAIEISDTGPERPKRLQHSRGQAPSLDDL